MTYDDSNLPSHYGWKIDSRLDDLEALYNRLRDGVAGQTSDQTKVALESQISRIIDNLDNQGRWISTYNGRMGSARSVSRSSR